jgi:uncharacterized protein with ParB-like and HNH nuclease domain
MNNLSNKIEAHDRSLSEVLDDKKYKVDYFQREYKWEERHIEQLISDLTSSFFNEYQPTHRRSEIEKYNAYYLGPFVVSESDGKRSIIDGQQRLTSLSLLLIYLNNLQRELGLSERIDSLIFSERYGEKSFNIQVEERVHCIEQLYLLGEYSLQDNDDESVVNIVARYHDIEKNFPETIKTELVFPFFIDWLKYRVILVEIIAYSDDNAYTIFETMNDRGLNLTPSEMLKGFLISKFASLAKREKANDYWKKMIQKLHEYDKEEDQRFFQAWFRAQYAESIRPGKAGSTNEDFEKVGTRFHSWLRENPSKARIDIEDPSKVESFYEKDLNFFLKAYYLILDAETTCQAELENVFYIKRWGIATSLSYPLMLAPLNLEDSETEIKTKISIVAKYIESYVVRRSLNYRKFDASSIRYTMYTLVKEIRNKSIADLRAILKGKLDNMEERIVGAEKFRLHGQNKYFVKFLLSRMTSFIELKCGINSSFLKYFKNPAGRLFEIEHLWADRMDHHSDEFDQLNEFQEFRNNLGALILLPNGTNQSFNSSPYPVKLPHYQRENILAQSLCQLTYQSNPNFNRMIADLGLDFKPYDDLKKDDVKERQRLYTMIIETIWGDSVLDE